jgi:hypothetical protein
MKNCAGGMALSWSRQRRALSLAKKAKSKLASVPSASSGDASNVANHRRSRWRWIVDNTMTDYGTTDYSERTVRINVLLHFLDRQSLIDTLVHEELHVRFPRYGEKRTCALTKARLKRMSSKRKMQLYRLVRSLRASQNPSPRLVTGSR